MNHQSAHLCRLWQKVGVLVLGFVLAAAACSDKPGFREDGDISFGVITDVHYADREEAINRFYRDSIQKVHKAVESFNERNLLFCIHLGDLVDKAESMELELVYLKDIRDELVRFKGDWYFVLGNHDLSMLSKEQFLRSCGGAKSYYSFDKGLFHFIVLDACFNKDESDYRAGNFLWTEAYIPAEEKKWLKKDLLEASAKTIVFIHQRLDDDNGIHGVKNAPLVRKILEESGKVLAVFQGHDHIGGYHQINGIHYCTFRAMVEGAGLENNAYAIIHIREDGTIEIKGFGKQGNLFLGVSQLNQRGVQS